MPFRLIGSDLKNLSVCIRFLFRFYSVVLPVHMLLKEQELYEFGDFRLDVTEHFMAKISDGEHIQISEKTFETLCVLVRNAGHLVNKNELLNQVWAESFVEENNLNKAIHAIRRALSEKSGEQKYIETVKKHGFRFVAEVRRIHSEEIADAVLKDNEFHSKKNGNSFAEFPQLVKQTETRKSGAVVALADWRRETVETIEQIPQISAAGKGDLTKQTGEIHLVSTYRKDESKNPTKQRLWFFSIAVFLIGAIAFGYFFYGGKKNLDNDGKKTIAVLPLKPINSTNRDDLYELGIADSLILRFGSIKGITVQPLSATRKYADIERDPITAGKEQQADYVLASNYQLANGKIKITAQLINVANGQIEETYKSEKDSSNIFATQDAIASEVGNIILARFSTTGNSPMAKRGTINEEAYRLYLQGKNLIMQRTAEDSRRSVAYLEQAIRLDPNFARSYSGLALAYNLSGEYEKAKASVEKALELDNNLSEAYAVRGSVNIMNGWDFPQAEKDLLRALELEPNNDLAHWLYGLFLGYRGRFDEGIREVETALMISPGTVVYIRDRARILFYARRYDEAIVEYKRALETDEGFGMVWNQLWMSYEMNGDYAMAYETFIKQQEKFKDEHLEDYKKAYAAAGWQGVKRKHLELSKLDENEPGTNFYGIARQCAMLGEKEQAFTYLNKSFEKHEYQMVLMYVEPRFDSLRDDPRFDELVKRVGLK
jgi:DNA-binding winged helix-turn-helix (wHTH) protein/tetratricopeptide (TPR) repeat protein